MIANERALDTHALNHPGAAPLSLGGVGASAFSFSRFHIYRPTISRVSELFVLATFSFTVCAGGTY